MCRLAAAEVAVDAHFGVAAHTAFKLRVVAGAVVGIQCGFPAGAVLFAGFVEGAGAEGAGHLLAQGAASGSGRLGAGAHEFVAHLLQGFGLGGRSGNGGQYGCGKQIFFHL